MDLLSVSAGEVGSCCVEKRLSVGVGNNNTKIMCAVVHYAKRAKNSTNGHKLAQTGRKQRKWQIMSLQQILLQWMGMRARWALLVRGHAADNAARQGGP